MSSFLRKLKRKAVIELVEPSEEIAGSYAAKAIDCLRSAKVLVKEGLYENAIGKGYYAMYNQALSFLFGQGSKSENHTATISLLKQVCSLPTQAQILKQAKKERVEKQYYVTDEHSKEDLKRAAEKMIMQAEQFIFDLEGQRGKANNKERQAMRERFEQL